MFLVISLKAVLFVFPYAINPKELLLEQTETGWACDRTVGWFVCGGAIGLVDKGAIGEPGGRVIG